MRRLFVVAALALLFAPGASAGPRSGGEYPAVLVRFVEDLVENAPATAWPPDQDVDANATRYLEQARANATAGDLQRAIDGYLLFHVENAYQHLYAQASGQPQSEARAIVHNATESIAGEGAALARGGRALINDLDVDALSLDGARTAAWGALLVARGENQLNLMDEVQALRLMDGDRIEPSVLRQQVFASVAGKVLVEAGTGIAAQAPHVPGETLPQGELFARFDQAARKRIQGTPTPELLDNMPRGDANVDSPLLRLGLTLHAAEEIRSIEIRRTYLNAAQRMDIRADVKEGLDFDKANLAPWARDGSPLSLAATEGVTLSFDEIDVRNQMGLITRARALAQTVLTVEKVVDPREANESPLPIGLVAGALGMAALAGRGTRRERRDAEDTER